MHFEKCMHVVHLKKQMLKMQLKPLEATVRKKQKWHNYIFVLFCCLMEKKICFNNSAAIRSHALQRFNHGRVKIMHSHTFIKIIKHTNV